jgi:hypothetical protein
MSDAGIVNVIQKVSPKRYRKQSAGETLGAMELWKEERDEVGLDACYWRHARKLVAQFWRIGFGYWRSG